MSAAETQPSPYPSGIRLSGAPGRRRSEEQARRWLAAIVECSNDAIVSVGLDGNVVTWNRAAERMLGWTQEEVVGHSLVEFAPEEHAREFGELAARILAGEPVENVESVRLHKDGTHVEVSLTLSPIFDELGQFIGASFVIRNVTDQKRTERALREMKVSLEHAVEGIAQVDVEGRYTAVNRAYADAMGCEPQAIIGRDWLELVHIEDHGRLVAARAEMLQLGKAETDVRGVRKDGTTVFEHIVMVASYDDHGRVVGHHCFMKDVTEKKRLEGQLVLSDRMVSVGTLAAGVAHEINNPLAYVTTNLDLIAEQLRDCTARTGETLGDMAELVEEARSGAERVRKIVRELKTFSRADEECRRVLDLPRVMDLAINMSFNEIRHRARLVKDYQNAPAVEADESRLAQVFINLLVNAAQALPEGYAHCNEIRVVIRTGLDGRALVEVRDTGCGIPPDILPRIFDPFFTTKPVGVGTGLGLSICHGIITALGGAIWADSIVGEGTVFRVALKAAELMPAPAVPAASTKSVAGRRARVLVVDDDPMVGACLRRGLRNEHDVSIAKNGREALERIVVGETYDVIFCDLMMPIMTGMDLHEALLEVAREHAERMVFVTGGAFTPAGRSFLDRVSNERLDKPFDIQNVRAVVRRFAP